MAVLFGGAVSSFYMEYPERVVAVAGAVYR